MMPIIDARAIVARAGEAPSCREFLAEIPRLLAR